jgi:hypothetical protein
MARPDYYYRNFKQSNKAKNTFNSYDPKLKGFMKYNGISLEDFSSLIEEKNIRQIEADVIDFIKLLKESIIPYLLRRLSALVHFFSINDVIIRRKKIAKFLSNDDLLSSIKVKHD